MFRIVFVVVGTVLFVVLYGAFVRNTVSSGYWWVLPILFIAPFAIGWWISTPEERKDFVSQLRELIGLRRR